MESEFFWLDIGSFGVYNIIIGYLLMHREETGRWSLLIYFFAMAMHFITNDFSLRQDHKCQYDRLGRWIIAGSVLLGGMLVVAVSIPDVGIGFVFAFLAGGVVLHVLKEELPVERQSRFLPFLMGGAAYAVLLMIG